MHGTGLFCRALCLWHAGCAGVMQSVTFRGKLCFCTVIMRHAFVFAVCVPHPAILRLCCRRRFCLHEGIGNRSTVSSPHTPQPLRTHFPSGFSATVSTELLRLRSRGDCLWQSFRSLAAYCSPSAHPRNFCCSAFALNGQKYIRMRAARSAATASHPCVEVATEGINNAAGICSAVCVPHSVNIRSHSVKKRALQAARGVMQSVTSRGKRFLKTSKISHTQT